MTFESTCLLPDGNLTASQAWPRGRRGLRAVAGGEERGKVSLPMHAAQLHRPDETECDRSTLEHKTNANVSSSQRILFSIYIYIYTAALFYTLGVEYYSTPQVKIELKKY
jgi:hypothetical protein